MRFDILGNSSDMGVMFDVMLAGNVSHCLPKFSGGHDFLWFHLIFLICCFTVYRSLSLTLTFHLLTRGIQTVSHCGADDIYKIGNTVKVLFNESDILAGLISVSVRNDCTIQACDVNMYSGLGCQIWVTEVERQKLLAVLKRTVRLRRPCIKRGFLNEFPHLKINK